MTAAVFAPPCACSESSSACRLRTLPQQREQPGQNGSDQSSGQFHATNTHNFPRRIRTSKGDQKLLALSRATNSQPGLPFFERK